jgi:excisionase family DNA binding protein
MDRVLYCEEVLERLNIKTGFLYKLINSGEIVSFKLGRRRAFMQSAVDDYIKKKSGKQDSNVIDIREISPQNAMAKGLEDLRWGKYSYESLCRIWSLVGEIEKEIKV